MARLAVLALLVAACGGSSMPPTDAVTPRLVMEPDSHDFGALAPTTTSATFVFTVRNTGDAPGDASSVTIDSAPFAAQSTCGSLAPGASCEIDVQFAPTALGLATGTLSVGDLQATVRGLGANAVAVTTTGGGSINSSPAGIACGVFCSASFAAPVTLTATPDSFHDFVGWGGACTGTGSCTIAADIPLSNVTATFAVREVALDVTVEGPATGTVTSSPAGIDCGTTCTASFDAGQQVALTAVATTGIFAGWSGACGGTNATCTLPLVFASSVTALFVQPCTASFSAKPRVGAGALPDFIVAGDVDGDGRLDLLTADHDDGTISIMRGNGDGTFQPRTTHDVGVYPFDVQLADLDGDGAADLVTALDGEVGVARGNGDGTFQATTMVNPLAVATAVAAADVDRDGHEDLVVTVTGGVSILRGHGDATFDAPTLYSVDPNVNKAAVGDLDRDGIVDIAVAASQEVVILRGNGDGTFTRKASYPVAGPWSLALADLDGDGDLDIAAPNVPGVSILVGHGDGTFDPPQSYAITPGGFHAQIADFTGDGVPDLAVATFADTVAVLTGNGNATFQPAVYFASPTSAMGVAVGDFDRDGAPDIAAVNRDTNDVTVFVDRTVCN